MSARLEEEMGTFPPGKKLSGGFFVRIGPKPCCPHGRRQSRIAFRTSRSAIPITSGHGFQGTLSPWFSGREPNKWAIVQRGRLAVIEDEQGAPRTRRLPMREIAEVLRLKASGLSTRQIAASLNVGRSAVSEYLKRAERAFLAAADLIVTPD